MKKTYISPVMDVTFFVAEQMITGSITQVGGDAGIEIGEGTPPDNADVKSNFNVWDDDWQK